MEEHTEGLRSSPEYAQHRQEVEQNLARWKAKPLLREIYLGFHRTIAARLASLPGGLVVELGSGIGNIKEVIPGCLRTDLFPNPWLDRVENAYVLSLGDGTVSDLILFDVFHHLRYPGTALEEFRRVLLPGGRIIIFDPCMSLLGLLVYGLLHHEPIGLGRKIRWLAGQGWSPLEDDYYAASGNASRIFLGRKHLPGLAEWDILEVRRLSAVSYVASGGYSKPQLYPDSALPLMRRIDGLCDILPWIFATRLLVVLRKKARPSE